MIGIFAIVGGMVLETACGGIMTCNTGGKDGKE